jgi:hypothetical protein
MLDTKEEIMGLIRHVLTTVGGILIAKGTIDEGMLTLLTGSILGIVGFVWSWTSKKKTA